MCEICIEYRERLALIVQSAYEEYRVVTIDSPNRQHGMAKTYLWLSSLIIAFDLKVYVDFLQRVYQIQLLQHDPTPLFLAVAAVSVVTAVLAFGLAMFTTLGRGSVKMPLGDDIMKFAEKAKEDAEKGSFRTYNSLIRSLDEAIAERIGYTKNCAILLRISAVSCLISLVVSLLSCGIFLLRW